MRLIRAFTTYGGIAQKRQLTSLFDGIPYLMTDTSSTCYEVLLFRNFCPRHVLSVAFFGTLSAFVSYDIRFPFLDTIQQNLRRRSFECQDA